MEDYNVILNQDPDDAVSLKNRADIYLEYDRAADAMADYGRLIELRPSCPLLWACYARAQFQAHQIQDCIESAEKSLSLPDEETDENDNAHFIAKSFLGLAAVEQRRVSEACDFFTEALKIVPDALSVRANRAQCHAELGNHSEAIRDFTKIIKVEAFAEFYLQRARSYQATGQLDSALADLDEAVGMDPSSAGLLVARAIVHQKLGDEEKALNDCNAALFIDPYDTQARQLLRTLEQPKALPSPKRRCLRSFPNEDADHGNTLS